MENISRLHDSSWFLYKAWSILVFLLLKQRRSSLEKRDSILRMFLGFRIPSFVDEKRCE